MRVVAADALAADEGVGSGGFRGADARYIGEAVFDPVAHRLDRRAALQLAELALDEALELVGLAISRWQQVLHRLARQQLLFNHRQGKAVGQDAIDRNSGAVIDGKAPVRAHPDPLADRVMRRHAGEVVVQRNLDMRVVDELLGDRGGLHLQQDRGRTAEPVIELGVDVDFHRCSRVRVRG